MTMQFFTKMIDCWYNGHTFFISYITTLLLVPLFDRVVIAPGLQVQVLETGVVPKQETATMFLNLCIRIP